MAENIAKSSQKENKMGTMPIPKLLISISLPMMISMLVQALYNIVDSIFVAQISENALTAVSLAFPVQNLMIAVATGTGVGINALLSRSLGAKRQDDVNSAAVNGVFLALLSFVAFAILGGTLSRTFFEIQTTNAEIISWGTDYLMIVTVVSFGIFGAIVFERLLQSTGKTIYSMISQSAGAVVNIIFDPIFIFGFFGIPAMGVAGAAIATVLGQIVSLVIACALNAKYNHEVTLKFKGFRPDRYCIAQIYSVGLPSIVMMSIGSIMTFCMNKILISFTETAATVFGAYFKLQSFIFMPVFGLNNGMVPIIAYNYGAKRKDRILKTIKLSIIYAMTLMVVGFAIFMIFPSQLLSMFNPSADMLAIGVPALRIISISFLCAGFCIVCGSVFQALGSGMKSLITSIVRQIVVLLPCAYMMSFAGLDFVWWAFPIAEIASVLLSAYFLKQIYTDKIAEL